MHPASLCLSAVLIPTYVKQDLHPGFLGFPKGKVVQEYIKAYSEHFKLRSHIRFNSKLKKLTRIEKDGELIRSWVSGY